MDGSGFEEKIDGTVISCFSLVGNYISGIKNSHKISFFRKIGLAGGNQSVMDGEDALLGLN
jgi:hypothetical protein